MGEQGQPEVVAQQPVNPQQEDNATSAELKEQKENFIKAATALDQMKEPIVELSALRDTMRAAVTSRRCDTDSAFATFL